MRPLRWKRGYLTAIAWVDEGNEVVVRILADLAGKLREKEHCQDMEDFYGVLVHRVQEWLARKAPICSEQSFDGELERLLATHLPLPALDTAACRSCGICDLTQERLMQWLARRERGLCHHGSAELGES
nr:hypothetical protein [Gammaproteobacteria bacterium]